MAEKKNTCRILMEKPLGKRHSDDLEGDWRITICVLGIWVVRMGEGWQWLRIVSSGGLGIRVLNLWVILPQFN
jgi:hypothetical protein